jgi:UDP-glucose 4-epimerase
VVLKSFTAVYGARASDPGLFREDDPVDRSASGFTRDVIDVEGYATSLARRRDDLELTTLRFANFVGGVEDSALSGYFSLPVVPSVLGFDPRLQFCHASDAVAAVDLAVRDPHPGLYNVAGPGTVYLSQAIRQAGRPRVALPSLLVNQAAGLLNRTGRVDVPTDQLTFLLFGRVVDTTRVVETFGWTPTHTTPEAFAAFLERRRDRGVTRRDLLALQRLVSSRLRAPVATRGGR